jgi:hypothetical protein
MMEMLLEHPWLTATAAICTLAISTYLINIKRGLCDFDMNRIVPLLLGCSAIVAAVRMITLSFHLPKVMESHSNASLLFDAGSVFIGGMIFALSSGYGVFQVIFPKFTAGREEEDNGRG